MNEIKSKDPKAISAMFSSIADNYDRLNRLLSLGQDISWRKRLVKSVDFPENGLILDVCTGTGDVVFAFLKENPEFKGMLYGIDFSALMLDKARGKIPALPRHLRNRIDFTVGDALNLQFRDDKFDVVSCAFGVRNFYDTLTGLKEMNRVLKPGGKAAILEFFSDGPDNKFVKFFLSKFVTSIGNKISGTHAYSYLIQSSSEFFSRNQFERTLILAGFKDVKWIKLTFGIAHIAIARKG